MSHIVHTVETAPNAAKESLRDAEKAYGFVPNLLGVMAEAPALLKAYRGVSKFFDETSLTPTERQVILLTTSSENRCEYCVAAHTVIAGMQKVPGPVIEAIRTGSPIEDRKLEALRRFTAAITTSRGWPSPADAKAFLNAGYTHAQMLEVVLGVGMKTLSNYTNHLAETPLDKAFAKASWTNAA